MAQTVDRDAVIRGVESLTARQHSQTCAVPQADNPDGAPCGWTGTSPHQARVHTGDPRPVYAIIGGKRRRVTGHQYVTVARGAQRADRRAFVARAVASAIVAGWTADEE